MRDPRHLHGARTRFSRRRHGQIMHGGNLAVPHGGGAAQHVYRLVRQITGAVGTHQHVGAGTVRHQAAVQDGQRVRHHACRQHVVDLQRVALECLGIQLGPFASSNRHLRELTSRSAVLVHVPLRGQRIGRDRRNRLVGLFKGLRV